MMKYTTLSNDANYKYLKELEKKEKLSLNEEEISYLLKWIAFNTQEILLNVRCDFKGLCGYGADILANILMSMHIKFYQINIRGKITKSSFGHAITIVNFKSDYDNMYILDPTYKQFMRDPDFITSTTLIPNGVIFRNNLINLGYFKITLENLKTYFDIFNCYKELKNNKNISYKKFYDGEEYFKLLFECPVHDNLPINQSILLSLSQKMHIM